MARLIDQTEIQMQWSDILHRVRREPPRHGRSPGVHLSGVIRAVAIDGGILADPNAHVDSTRPGMVHGRYQDVDETVMPLRMMMGTFFEEGLATLMPDMDWQPGELEADGISGNPDGFSLASRGYVLDEIKLTWKSIRNYAGENGEKFTSSNWLWMAQAKGYLAMALLSGLPIEPIARFHVGWANGDYMPPSPRLIRYTVEFSRLEIDHFWKNVIVANRSNPRVVPE